MSHQPEIRRYAVEPLTFTLDPMALAAVDDEDLREEVVVEAGWHEGIVIGRTPSFGWACYVLRLTPGTHGGQVMHDRMFSIDDDTAVSLSRFIDALTQRESTDV